MSTASAQEVALAIGSGSTNAGGKLTVNLALTNSGGSLPASVEWTIIYPVSDITGVITAVGAAATAASKTIGCHSISGSTTCTVYGLNADAIGTGTLAAVTFQVAAAPPDSKVAIQITNPVGSRGDGEGVAATGTGGTVSIVSTAPVLTSFSCSPTSFSSAGSSTCTVGLSGAASTGGLGVTVGSSNSSVSVPAAITVPQGSSSASFTAAVVSVKTSQTATVTAKAGSGSKSSSFSLTPSGPTPVLLSSVACSPSSVSSGASALCGLTLTGPATASILVSITSSNKLLAVPSSVTISQNQTTATFTATAGTTTTTQSAIVTAAGPNNAQTFTETVLAPSSSVSIWSTSTVPGTVTDPDTGSVEIGLKFRASTAGSVSGVRFYKGPQNTGVHVGHLWTRTGQLLATVTFNNETATGWEKAMFSSPVTIQANTTYVVSYHTSVGHYSSDENYFNSAVTNGSLQALKDGTDGGNGVYLYGSGGFPDQTWNASNYWVDVVFTPSSSNAAKSQTAVQK